MTGECLISCTTSQGHEIRGSVQHFMRYEVVFEIYSPGTVLQNSEVLSDFKIIAAQGPIYVGRAIIVNVVHSSVSLLCQASLEDAWTDLDFLAVTQKGRVGEEFGKFFKGWEKLYKVRSNFKVIVADLQAFLMDLRLWLEQVELAVRSAPAGDRGELERDMSRELGHAVYPPMEDLFQRFEESLENLEEEERPVHYAYSRRQLHPLVLCAPFVYRTYQKPLGYAGDYEMVNMIVRDPHEGGSLFAKMVNYWFVAQPPAQAHRNRIDHLTRRLGEEAARVRASNRPTRIFSLGCGPAWEMQRLLQQGEMPRWTRFTLVDFNQETLLHLESIVHGLRARVAGDPSVELVRKSVGQLLKESGRQVAGTDKLYDVVYCAGLLDYLPDKIGKKLIQTLLDFAAPDGVLLVTNVSPVNPRRRTMESLLEWNLIYRTRASMEAMLPSGMTLDEAILQGDPTGSNFFMEMRRSRRG